MATEQNGRRWEMILESTPGREVRTARKSCMPTQAIAAGVCGLGLSAYRNREENQDDFSIGELRRLYRAMGTDGKDTLADWVVKNFSSRP